jgi:hypothetical protein
MLCLVASLFFFFFLLLGKHGFDQNPNLLQVTFYNSSSFIVSIHHSSFSGPVLVDKLASGKSFSTAVSPSGNYGIGSVFSVEYWFMVANGAEVSGGDVWTGGIVDPNAQIIQNLETGKNYPIRIPQPENWESAEAFVKIANKSDKPIEFNHLGVFYRQGNLEPAVPSGKVGIYKVNKINPGEDSIEIKNCTITQVFETYPFPEFTAVDGYIYSFEFDGKEVKRTGEDKI